MLLSQYALCVGKGLLYMQAYTEMQIDYVLCNVSFALLVPRLIFVCSQVHSIFISSGRWWRGWIDYTFALNQCNKKSFDSSPYPILYIYIYILAALAKEPQQVFNFAILSSAATYAYCRFCFFYNRNLQVSKESWWVYLAKLPTTLPTFTDLRLLYLNSRLELLSHLDARNE